MRPGLLAIWLIEMCSTQCSLISKADSQQNFMSHDDGKQGVTCAADARSFPLSCSGSRMTFSSLEPDLTCQTLLRVRVPGWACARALT